MTQVIKKKCGQRCEVYSRVVGYHRPIVNWNVGKKEEFKQRVVFDEKMSIASKFGNRGCLATEFERANVIVTQ
ncbi:hypothetical protein HOK51_05445 [Candidatus Woesearchaeota archaeon]|jgi:hypothetical protein|nr:hypothetical protein [Candidatus Woesearchaeota archaeon]MBT6519272.1 hypothetical protein [Candidatus Woesearchaeota archaeon]MBT7368464.1 hypothetical protein [Candidatus Woesearchaeota archaeon]